MDEPDTTMAPDPTICSMDVCQPSSSSTAHPSSAVLDLTAEVSSTTELQPDVSDTQAIPGSCGLFNLGNTCFINAGLQCLFSNRQIVQYFLEGEVAKEPLVEVFSKIVHKVWSGQYRAVSPRLFKSVLATYHPQFKDFRQHDCQEFLAFLLDTLHEQLKPSLHSVSSTFLEHSSNTGGHCGLLQPHSNTGGHCEELQPHSNTGGHCEELGSQVVIPSPSEETIEEEVNLNLSSNMDVDEEEGCSGRRIPTIEDLCMKDTKTLNTNVVLEVTDDEESALVDSSKFHKPVNINAATTDYQRNLLSAHQEKEEYDKQAFSGDREAFSGDREALLTPRDCKRELLNSESDNTFHDSGEKSHSRTFNNTEVSDVKHRLSPVQVKRLRREAEVMEKNVRRQLTSDTGLAGCHGDDVIAADEQWLKYINNNQSLISDSFQGQFRSSVICSECQHVSVTFEPFMYLSLPIPHAMDLELCVTFVPYDSQVVTQFLVKVHRHDKVQAIKLALGHLVQEAVYEVVMAEVLDHHIARLLEDTMTLRYLHDQTREIYAFEVLPVELDKDVVDTGVLTGPQGPPELELMTLQQLNNRLVSEQTSLCTEDFDLETEQESGGQAEEAQLNNLVFTDHSALMQNTESLELRCDVDWQPNLLDQVPGPPCSTPQLSPIQSEPVWMNQSLTLTQNRVGWSTCAVCLEELADEVLLIHTTCRGTLCTSCFDMTIKHYEKAAFICPVCNNVIDAHKDYVPIKTLADYQPINRLLLVPVLRRLECLNEDTLTMRLSGHPGLIHVSSQTSSDTLYSAASRALSLRTHSYQLVLTDGQGLRCSRCLYTSHCSGCPITREGGLISLQPADHVTVCVGEGEEAGQEARVHESVRTMRPKQAISLDDCISAFCQSELLDEQNPWFCPRCCRSRTAKKNISIWKYPESLIIHLKRFVFQDLVSSKIDVSVAVPLSDLDLSHYTSGPAYCGTKYELRGCIVHHGYNLSHGHYTAYTRHLTTNKWFHYNDDIITAQSPSDKDLSDIYVLFYQRSGASTGGHYEPSPLPWAEVDDVDEWSVEYARQLVDQYKNSRSKNPSKTDALIDADSVLDDCVTDPMLFSTLDDVLSSPPICGRSRP